MRYWNHRDDAGALCALLERPEMRAALCPRRPVTFDECETLLRPLHIVLGDHRGALIFKHISGGVYEFHYALTVHGQEAITLVREALHKVFTCHYARAIVGATPRENRAARAMNRALGARPVRALRDSQARDCILYSLDRVSWETSLAASSAVSAPCSAVASPSNSATPSTPR